MERQRHRVARFGREAEAAAHEAYGKAIRAGQELKLGSPGEVMRHGAEVLEESENRAADAVSSAARRAKRQANHAINRVGDTPGLRSVAVGAAGSAGTLAGVVRGGVHAMEGLAEGAMFVGRLANPLDRYLSLPGHSANDQLANAGRQVADYVGKGLANPRMVVNDVKSKAHQMHVDLDPGATPPAPTFAGELRRNFDIGQNVGELAFDVGSFGLGGPGAKAVKGLGRASNVGNVDRYLAQGFSPTAAAHLAEPYPSTGMGHHFIPRRKELPESYSDSVFNVLKPEGISRGDFYELHYKVDPAFRGGPGVPGEGWSGKRLGLKEYGLGGRLWHGSPPPLKARIGGLGAATGGALYWADHEEMGW